VTERFSGNLSIGLGFSQVQGAVLNLGFAHDNIFGTGNEVSFTFNNSKASEQYSFRYKNPYYTPEGISRGFSFTVTETDAAENNTSNYLIDRVRFSIDYGIPLSEFNTLSLEVGALRNDLSTTSGTADEIFDFIIENSDDYDESTPESEIEGDDYDTLFTKLSLSKDTRNRRIFADSGALNGISLELNGGDLYYYKARYLHQSAFGLSELLTLNLKGRVGYGDGFNDTTQLPPYEKYHAGGVRSVRGFEFNSLGPVDSNGDSLGGDFQTIATVEILFPIGDFQTIATVEILFPIDALASSETFRVGVYFDVGNVFADVDDFETVELRQTVGISAKWFSFIGPIEFSYAWPLNDEPEDDVQNFQFALGATF